jgi:hypothetical protein
VQKWFSMAARFRRSTELLDGRSKQCLTWQWHRSSPLRLHWQNFWFTQSDSKEETRNPSPGPAPIEGKK